MTLNNKQIILFVLGLYLQPATLSNTTGESNVFNPHNIQNKQIDVKYIFINEKQIEKMQPGKGT